MSLSKQLYLGLILILSLMFVGSLWINVNNTRDYINNQLASHAQDTATSLGLSIKPFIGNPDDLPMVDGMIKAIFDSGYYQQVVLKDNQGQIILEKNNPLTLDAVPNWFIKLFTLAPPQASTEIHEGWTKPKILLITSHPGFGYQQLWRSAVKSTGMILGLFLLAGSLMHLVLKTITNPIKKAVQQADEICQGNFVQVDEIPKPKELNLFVNAMNRMSKILQNMFNELTQQAEIYRQFAYVDELTNFANRRAFNNQFRSLLADQEQAGSGYLLIIRMSSLNEINQTVGYSGGDDYIKQAAMIIDQHVNSDTLARSHQSYRIGGSDFAILLTHIDKSECQKVVAELIASFNNASTEEYLNGFAHIGISDYSLNSQMPQILDQADSALTMAMTDKNRWQFADSLAITQSNRLWQKQLKQLLKQQKVMFVAQAIKDKDATVLYRELYGRFNHSEFNTPIPMAQLMQVAERLHLADQFDRLVIRSALSLVSQKDVPVALNLSPISLGSMVFCDWLISQLCINKGNCEKLVFEFSERSLAHHADNVCDMAHRLKGLGCKITLEHFGASTSSFVHLLKIKPNYVKIDGGYCQQLDDSTENQQFVQSLVNIAHSLQIGVIAELVETPEQLSQLQSLFVDYFQGFSIEKPTTWPS